MPKYRLDDLFYAGRAPCGLNLGKPRFKMLALRAFKRMQFVAGTIRINSNKLGLYPASGAYQKLN